jgi:outer membrane receptor protein involved in Fe transport
MLACRSFAKLKPIVLVLICAIARAQQTTEILQEVIVTAQKHAEDLQAVPVSVKAIGEQQLRSDQVTDLRGYTKLIPSLSTQDFGPGEAQLYVRGVSNGNDGDPIGSQPSVAVYVDEMPVTTISQNLDLHMYDIARVEALSGPQGTLFGASAMAGALRIITNPPDTKKFSAGYDLTANTFPGGSDGGSLEGFVNLPLSERAAIRLVGFHQHDGGFINNVLGPAETFPTSGLPRSNATQVKPHFNELNSSGVRGQLKVNLNNGWTVDASVIQQQEDLSGTMNFTPALGDLNVASYFPEQHKDRWWLAALTITGKIGDFSLTYAGGYLRRDTNGLTDNSELSFFFDQAFPGFIGPLFVDNQGNLVAPAFYGATGDHFSKQPHELRFSTPDSWRLRATAGLFIEHQGDRTRGENRIAGLADQYSISRLPGVLYLNSQIRTDRDRAIFIDGDYDLTGKLTLGAGLRRFEYDNTVRGFFGTNGQPTSLGFIFGTGEQNCFADLGQSNPLWPCVNIDARTKRSGETYRATVRYRFDSDHMLYATWSTGFRPGGVNRGLAPPYTPDYLTNFELGWKTEWLHGRLRFNGALFVEKWRDAQLALPGVNALTQVVNAGRAESRGLESELTWRLTRNFELSASIAVVDARLKSNLCLYPSPSLTCTEPRRTIDDSGNTVQEDPNSIQETSGSRLPLAPKFKWDVSLRQEFPAGSASAFIQATLSGKSSELTSVGVVDFPETVWQPPFATVDMDIGLRSHSWQFDMFAHNVLDRRGEVQRGTICEPPTCSLQHVFPIAPRLIGVRIGQQF